MNEIIEPNTKPQDYDDLEVKAVDPINAQELKAMESNSVKNLPASPVDSGLKSPVVQPKFYLFAIGSKNSLYSFFNERMIIVNEALQAITSKFNKEVGVRLKTQIEGLISDLATAVEAVNANTQNLSSEVELRDRQKTEIDNAIVDEIKNRKQAITDEETARNEAIKAAINNLINGNGEALDTLKEITEFFQNADTDIKESIVSQISKLDTALRELVSTTQTAIYNKVAEDYYNKTEMDSKLTDLKTDITSERNTALVPYQKSNITFNGESTSIENTLESLRLSILATTGSANDLTTEFVLLRDRIKDEEQARASGDESINKSLDSIKAILNTNVADFDTLQEIADFLNTNQNAKDIMAHVNDKNNPHGMTKSQIGLSNVDNTSDVNKPVSTAQKSAFLKAYYNLGAYDTVEGNTVTRQTGYITINREDILNVKLPSSSGTGVYRALTNLSVQNYGEVDSSINYGDNCGIASNNYSVKNSGEYWSNDKTISINKETTIAIGSSTMSTIEEYQEQCPIYIQYKKNTKTVEKIIEGQPISKLAQYGEEFIYNDLLKSVNLCNIDTIASTNGSTQTKVSAGKTYTISFYINADSISLNIRNSSSMTASVNQEVLKTIYNRSGFVRLTVTPTVDGYVFFNGYSETNFTSFSNIAVMEGDVYYPYQPYNANKHITNEEASLLKREFAQNSNLWDDSLNIFSDSEMGVAAPMVIPAGTYTVSWHNINPSTGQWQVLINNSPIVTLEMVNTLTYTFTIAAQSTFKVYANNGSTEAKLMLNEGNVALPYRAHNSSKHITNNQANFLKEELEKTLNLFDCSSLITGNSWNMTMSNLNLKPNTTYTIKTANTSFGGGSISTFGCRNESGTTTYLWKDVYTKTLKNGFSFTTPNIITKSIYLQFGTQYTVTEDDKKIMLVEGSEMYPFQEYNGSIVHQKELLESFELYGTKPAMTSISVNSDVIRANSQGATDSYSVGSSIAELSLNTTRGCQITILPTNAINSVSEATIEYLSGDEGYISYSLTFYPNNNYINADAIAQQKVYGYKYYSGTVKTTTYRITIKDIYGHVFTQNFTIDYRA